MTTFLISHTPFTTNEPFVVASGLSLDEARERMSRRAGYLAKIGYNVSWHDGLRGFEVTDDNALLIDDRQGNMRIERET